MERGVIAGGVLITASFLLAVLLNHSAVKEGAPMPETDTHAAERAIAPPALATPVLDGHVSSTRSGSSDDPGCCKPDDASCLDRKTHEARGHEPPCVHLEQQF